MGSDHSRPGNDTLEVEGRPPDYYDLLQITEDATEDEIRVSRRSHWGC